MLLTGNDAPTDVTLMTGLNSSHYLEMLAHC